MPGPKVEIAQAVAEAPQERAPEIIEDAAPGQVLKRGAAPPVPTNGKPGEPLVRVRITKAGHEKVHTGSDLPEDGPKHYTWNDEVALPRSVAEALEERHYAEIQ